MHQRVLGGTCCFFPEAPTRDTDGDAGEKHSTDERVGGQGHGKTEVGQRCGLRACFQLAGIIGVEPWSFTLRELDIMARERMMLEWDQTSLLWSMMANQNRDTKKQPKPFLPSVVHPLRNDDEYGEKKIPADISILKGLVPHGR